MSISIAVGYAANEVEEIVPLAAGHTGGTNNGYGPSHFGSSDLPLLPPRSLSSFLFFFSLFKRRFLANAGSCHVFQVNSNFTRKTFANTFTSMSHVNPRVLYPSLNFSAFDTVSGTICTLHPVHGTNTLLWTTCQPGTEQDNARFADGPEPPFCIPLYQPL